MEVSADVPHTDIYSITRSLTNTKVLLKIIIHIDLYVAIMLYIAYRKDLKMKAKVVANLHLLEVYGNLAREPLSK